MSRRNRRTTVVGKVRDKPWMCGGCGYMMDAATCATDHTVTTITDGDCLSICLNCGAVYERQAGRWAMMTAEARAALPADTKSTLLRLLVIRASVVRDDLTARDGRA